MPDNPWLGKVERYASLQAACEAGVAAEIANAELYERLLGATRRPDILAVLRNLQEASQQRHLAAFQRCGWTRQGPPTLMSCISEVTFHGQGSTLRRTPRAL
ncbi:hypothetical protein QEP73_17190 [Pseudomonas defluvii]|nr:hypothetical protein QEP73_17190 [Pseudomonas defluvii]